LFVAAAIEAVQEQINRLGEIVHERHSRPRAIPVDGSSSSSVAIVETRPGIVVPKAAAAAMIRGRARERDVERQGLSVVRVPRPHAHVLLILDPVQHERDARALIAVDEVGGGPALAGAATLAMMILAGAPQLVLHAGCAVALYALPALVGARPRARRILLLAAIPILVPPLAALAAVRIEPFLDLRWAPVIVLPLVAEDGRWLGGTLGAWLPGGIRFSRAIRVGLASIPAGPGMVAAIAIGLQAGVLAPTVGGGLLVGVLLIEILAPIRGRFAADLARTAPEADDRTGS
jgi:hypothetical protein